MMFWSGLKSRMSQAVKRPLARWVIGGVAASILAGFLILLYARAPVTLDQETEKVTFFQIGTGASDGPYFGLGRRLAAIISRPPDAGPCEAASPCGVEGLLAVVKSSAGSVANVRAVSAGHFASALIQSTTLDEARRATGPFRGEKRFTNLRAIAGISREAVHVVASRGANIRIFGDLKGKRVAVGGKDSENADIALSILRAYGLTSRNVDILREEPERAAELMLRGQLDAFFLIAGAPDPRVVDLANRGTIDLIAIDGDAATKLVADRRDLSPLHVAADVYRLSPGFDTLAVNAVWVCNASADADLVRDLTRALFEPGNRELLPAYDDMPRPPKKRDRAMEEAMRRGVMMNAVANLPIPIHDGAARFYREEGVLPAK